MNKKEYILTILYNLGNGTYGNVFVVADPDDNQYILK